MQISIENFMLDLKSLDYFRHIGVIVILELEKIKWIRESVVFCSSLHLQSIFYM